MRRLFARRYPPAGTEERNRCLWFDAYREIVAAEEACGLELARVARDSRLAGESLAGIAEDLVRRGLARHPDLSYLHSALCEAAARFCASADSLAREVEVQKAAVDLAKRNLAGMLEPARMEG